MAVRRKVLIVEAEELVAYNITEYLNQTSEDFTADRIFSSEEALAVLEKS